jgi:hypothetical protein
MSSYDLLRDRILGPVLTPADPGFTEEASGFNLAISHTPDVVIGVTSARDVAEAVRFAAAEGMPVRVQATGHGAHYPISGGMLLMTRRLDDVTVDPQTGLASVGAGATWRMVQAAATAHGLTGIPGSSMTVGAVGYALGGGLGPLSRSHGFTSDYVRGFEVVTADGETVTANNAENAELFWALRGGKVGLGLVTRMQMELVRVDSLYAGSVVFADEHLEDALRGWIEWTHSAPDDVTTSVAILNLPDLEVVPPPLRGRRVLTLRFAYPGATADGERLAAPLRELAPAMMDAIGPLETRDIGRIHNDPDQPGPGWSRGMLLNALDQDFATRLLERVGAGTTAPIIVTELRHLGAATTTDVAGGSAVGGRASSYAFTLVGTPNPELFDAVLPAFADGVVSSIRPWISEETTVNFAGNVETMEELAPAWPRAIHDRLQAARALYDPRGLFTYGASSA